MGELIAFVWSGIVVFLTVAKLSSFITWSWLWVLSPIWIMIIIVVILVAIMMRMEK